jgi:ribosomal protein L40E
MFVQHITTAIAGAKSLAGLDHIARTIWKSFSAGVLDEGDAQRLAEVLEARRSGFRASRQASAVPVGKLSLFASSRLQRPPNRSRSIRRRRQLAASGPLPPAMAASFTVGELSVLRIVADEVRDKGVCDRTYAELAARAGVCRSTAKNAIRQAKRLELVSLEERRRPGHKSLPNLIRIISVEWWAWLELGRRRDRRQADRQIGGKVLIATAIRGFRGGESARIVPTFRSDRGYPNSGDQRRSP